MDIHMRKPFVLTGRHVLIIMVAFFAVVIGTNIVFVRFAVGTFPGEEVDKSYYQGLHYNDVLAEKRRQSENGWRLLLVEPPRAEAVSHLDVKIMGPGDRPVYDAEITGSLVRPTTELGQTELEFHRMDGGIYRAATSGIAPGAWDLSLTATSRRDQNMRASATSRIVVQ
jgi:nitrogen fixation protein FixH